MDPRRGGASRRPEAPPREMRTESGELRALRTDSETYVPDQRLLPPAGAPPPVLPAVRVRAGGVGLEAGDLRLARSRVRTARRAGRVLPVRRLRRGFPPDHRQA